MHRRALRSFVFLFVFLAAVTRFAHAQTQVTANSVIPPSAVSVAAGATVTAGVTNGPGNRTDWVALYPQGGGSYLDWFYLNGLKSAPATGLTTASVNFTMPQTNGAYEIRFLPNDGFTATAVTGPIKVVPPPSLTSLTPSTGSVGNTVVVAGTGFGQSQGSGGVSFNGTAATVLVWSATSISVRVPSGASTGSVIVTASGQASNGVIFTVSSLSTGTLSGTITRTTGGAAVSGASVQAILAGVSVGSATTNGSGAYSISALAPGTYDARVSATGLFTEVRSTSISSGATTTLNVGMLQPGSISGKVTQSNGTTPIAGAAVTLYSGPTPKGAASTNATGDYSVGGLRPGSYTVQAASAGYATKEQSATISENANTTSNASLNTATSGSVNYVYDELGRLVSVISPEGVAAHYTYDAVGNLLSIVRPSTNAVSISEFTPNAAAVGASVTIYGTGFSTTPSSNTVSFHGTGATVTSATVNRLVVTLPSGATTGTISVTSPNGSATSAASFTVLASGGGAPTITNFSPSAGGAAGTAVTITGTNFETVIANDVARINTTLARVTAATATSLTTSVPTQAGSGHVSVSTPAGTAVSTADFIVPPAPYTTADVFSSARLSFGTATTVTVSTANKIALLLFDGAAGQRVSLLGTNGMTGQILGCDVYVSLLSPTNGLLAPAACMEGSGFIDTVVLPSTATYSILVDPSGSATGSVTLTLYNVPADVTTTLSAGGSPVTVTTTTPGQNATLTFSGTANQRVSLAGSDGMTAQVLGCDVNVSVLAPDGSVLFSPTCMEGSGLSGFTDVMTLPAAGTYSVLVDPVSLAVGSLTLTLYNVPADATGSVTIGGSAANVTITTPGQNGAVTFSGTSGQQVTVHVTNNPWLSLFGGVTVKLLNGTTVLTSTSSSASSFDLSPVTLPATGTFTIVIDPVSTETGSISVGVTSP